MAVNVKNVKSKSSTSKQPLLDTGTYPVRVCQIVDLGLQAQQPYQGKEKPPAHAVSIAYQFLDECCLDEDGKEMPESPRILGERFAVHSLSSDRAKSTLRYNAIDPTCKHDGDFLATLGTPCMLTVVHNSGKGQNAGNTYANVGAVTSMRDKDAAKAPELVGDGIAFDLDEPSLEVFNDLPEFLQDLIKANLNYEGSALQKLLGGVPSEEGAEEEKGEESGEEGSESDW